MSDQGQSAEALASPPAAVLSTLKVTLLVSAVVVACSYALPVAYAAQGVAFVFFAAVYWLVLRRDAPEIRAYGVALGGLLEPSRFELQRALRDMALAIAWAAVVLAVVLPPYWVGFRLWWELQLGMLPELHFTWPPEFVDTVLGQIVVIALPEEMFFRGYVQTQLDRALGRPLRFLGADIGWGLVLTSALFALGHLATQFHVERLSVFFPSLLFGWLRCRTGGVGAAVLVHAGCNLFASTLARGYGLTP